MVFKRTAGLAVLGLLSYLFWWPWFHSLRHANPTHTSLMMLRESQARGQRHKRRSVLVWRPLSQISPALVHALLLAEDDQFFQHSGFDLSQILVALQKDWQEKRFAYGGSTLTQQLARTLYLSPRKNILRKAKEAFITLWLEHTLSKTRILEIYLNVVEWGRGIYGAEAAARFYFRKPAKDLTPDESVALVSILPSPRRWSPFSERSFMARRRTNILEAMRKQGYINDEDSSLP
jgi:monofunctional biosynthetic peptidoglycan transglycosylase